MALLAGLILLGSTVFKEKPLREVKPNLVKAVKIFKIGEAPKVSVQAVAKKSGVIKILAQTPGIVSSINVLEGDEVSRGVVLIGLSSNYQGGVAQSVQRMLAQTQFNNVRNTFDKQKEIVQKQKDLANKNDENADQLRDITNKSISDTQGLIDLNNTILSSLNSNLTAYEATNSGGLNNSLILQTQSQKSQFQAVNNQLNQALRNAQYQAASDKPPAGLSDIGREVAIKQLEIQEKALELNKEVSRLNLVLAQISEAQMFPAAPFNGRVERVHVKTGEAVNPGMPLLTISQTSDDITLDAKVPREIAQSVSQFELSNIIAGNKIIQKAPYYVSGEATDGQLYSVLYLLEDSFKDNFTEGGYVTVEIPVGTPDSGSIVPFIPIDAVFQTQEESVVYLIEGDRAKSRKIILGQVQGRFVEVKEGIGASDQVILNRNVVEGDRVHIE